MSMSKQDFIALANAIRAQNKLGADCSPIPGWTAFTQDQIETLADFYQTQNGNFMRERWLDYIAGKCGPNGGAR